MDNNRERLQKQLAELNRYFNRDARPFMVPDHYGQLVPPKAPGNGWVDPGPSAAKGVVVGFGGLAVGAIIAMVLFLIYPWFALAGAVVGVASISSAPAIYGANANRRRRQAQENFDAYLRVWEHYEEQRKNLLFASTTSQNQPQQETFPQAMPTTVLMIRCRFCKFKNDEIHKFCAKCGQSLL